MWHATGLTHVDFKQIKKIKKNKLK